MSGAADDDSAPSNSTPQSPEGAEGAPDVTVTESKPDTPGSHVDEDSTSRSESKNETPTEQPSENTEPAKEENVAPVKEETAVTNDESKTDTGDGTADVEEPKTEAGEGAQNTSEESPPAVEEERIGEPAPETGETVKQDDTKSSGVGNEATSNENEKGDTGESKQSEEPTKEAGETEGVTVVDQSAKDEGKVDEGSSVDKSKAENECENANETGADESTINNDNNNAANGTVQNAETEAPADIPESDTQEMKSNEVDNAPETEAPAADALNTESLATDDGPSEGVKVKQGECAEDNPTLNNPDDRATVTNINDGDAPSNPEENAEHKVEISELDSLKSENKRLGMRVKELEDEIDGIREGRKEGMKVQADYLVRELSQQQNTEKYLREKLAEVLQEKEESERRTKDLQLRLKRFAKDDQSKDARLAKTEQELRDITHEVQILESMLDADTLRSVQEQRVSGKVNGPSGAGTGTNKGTAQPPPPQSKTCVIL